MEREASGELSCSEGAKVPVRSIEYVRKTSKGMRTLRRAPLDDKFASATPNSTSRKPPVTLTTCGSGSIEIPVGSILVYTCLEGPMAYSSSEGSILLLGGSGRVGKLFVDRALKRGKLWTVESPARC